MAQATDVVLDGAGYMVAGKYQRTQDGAPDGRTGRVALRDFFGGLRRHVQLERDKGYTGTSIGPALGGQGVVPRGRKDSYTIANGAGIPLPSISSRIPYTVVGNAIYFARGKNVYKTTTLDSLSWVADTLVYTAPADIVDMCTYASNGILLTFGAANDVLFYSIPGATATVLLADEKGYAIAGYAGYAAWVDARTTARKSYIRMVHSDGVDNRILDYDVNRIVTAGAKLYALTASSIHSFTGRVHQTLIPNPAWTTGSTEPTSIPGTEWSGEWTPFFQHGVVGAVDDHIFFTGFGGRIYTWIDGAVMEFDPDGDRAGWRDTGLRGVSCNGGCVAGGYLVVSIVTAEGRNQLWAWDGSGWWPLDDKATGSDDWCQLIPTQGAGSYDLIAHRAGQTTADLYRLRYRTATYHNYPSSGELVTPLIDAGERDKAKAWRKVGAIFATPERLGNPASVDAVTVQLAYSVDGGNTWTSITSVSKTGNTLANNQFTLDADIASAAAVSRFLMIRVQWSSVLDWAPVLVGLWTEYEALDSPARRRRWRFTVKAQDQTIDRAGALLTRTGRQLIAELWAAWQGGTTLPFRDIDYDADATERQVRIVGIAETTERASDAGRWGDSAVLLDLVEV